MDLTVFECRVSDANREKGAAVASNFEIRSTFFGPWGCRDDFLRFPMAFGWVPEIGPRFASIGGV